MCVGRLATRPYIICDVVELHETLQSSWDDGTVRIVNKSNITKCTKWPLSYGTPFQNQAKILTCFQQGPSHKHRYMTSSLDWIRCKQATTVNVLHSVSIWSHPHHLSGNVGVVLQGEVLLRQSNPAERNAEHWASISFENQSVWSKPVNSSQGSGGSGFTCGGRGLSTHPFERLRTALTTTIALSENSTVNSCSHLQLCLYYWK